MPTLQLPAWSASAVQSEREVRAVLGGVSEFPRGAVLTMPTRLAAKIPAEVATLAKTISLACDGKPGPVAIAALMTTVIDYVNATMSESDQIAMLSCSVDELMHLACEGLGVDVHVLPDAPLGSQ
jgi:hypothetical protein